MYLECGGTHYEMGFQQGRILKDSIKKSFDSFFEFEPIKRMRPKYLNSDFIAETAGVIAYNFLMKKMDEFDPEAYQRIKGLADGSGLNINLFLFIQFFESLISTPFMTTSGCTTAMLDRSRTRTRSSLIIKDYDLFTVLPMTTCVRRSSPNSRLKSLELIISALTGNHIGLNEAGLAVSYNYGMERTIFNKNLSPTLNCQYVLENFARTKQAVEFIRDMGTSNGAIIFILDETGDGLILEVLGRHSAVRRRENGFAAASNIFLHPDMVRFNYKDTDRYDNFLSPKPYQGMLINTTNHMRYDRINELLNKTVLKRLSIRKMKSILKDHGGEKEGNDNTICRHSDVLSTLASVILNIRERKMEVSVGPPCRNPYKTYSLK